MNDVFRRLLPACVLSAVVLLLTLAVLTWSPLFVAVPVSVLCVIGGHALLGRSPVALQASALAFAEFAEDARTVRDDGGLPL